jgi:hypothetical protein
MDVGIEVMVEVSLDNRDQHGVVVSRMVSVRFEFGEKFFPQFRFLRVTLRADNNYCVFDMESSPIYT